MVEHDVNMRGSGPFGIAGSGAQSEALQRRETCSEMLGYFPAQHAFVQHSQQTVPQGFGTDQSVLLKLRSWVQSLAKSGI